MEDTGDDHRIHEGQAEHSTFDGEDIYAEDGSVRSDFLMHVGAAIADRDLLFLRRHVARLHESEMGDLLEAIQPEQRRQLVSLLGADFDLAALTEVDEAIRLHEPLEGFLRQAKDEVAGLAEGYRQLEQILGTLETER